MVDPSLRLVLKVAYLYYVGQQTQESIAVALRLSRSKVSRLLSEARERGLVEVKINYPVPENIHLERRLEEHFQLHEAVIVSDTLGLPDGIGQQVASAAASYLLRILRPESTLGVAASSTLAQVIPALRGRRTVALTVVQLFGQMQLGNAATPPTTDGYEVTRGFADALGARYQLLFAPAITERQDIGRALRSDPTVRRTLELARRASVALVGIGPVGPASSVVRSGLLGSDDLERLAAQNAVGEICTRFFDVDGRPCSTSLDERVIGVTLDDLRAMPLVVGVACGRVKAPSILGALRGGYIKVLVTDEDTADEVLRIAGTTWPPKLAMPDGSAMERI